MSTTFQIAWDGESQGLPEQRLSLALFATPLEMLIKAARNIAVAQVNAALGNQAESDRGTRKTLIDLQLATYRPGSANLELVCTVPPKASPPGLLVPDLEERVARELLESIREESSGRRRNRFVNEYLHSLPSGLNVQRYSLARDGRVLETIEVKEMRLAELAPEVPQLRRLFGQIVAVSMYPMADEISIAPLVGEPISLPATAEQVLKAHDLFGKPVTALAIIGEKRKLLWIRSTTEPGRFKSDVDRQEHIFTRWDETLRRLAE